ncbi:serine hydrolase domain-containing protein [Lysobacter sp. cf310]|uniref:serine hydrolase domain-containing protein n=1 Tax=Lysobacter sp. cf310 TaxID=1761790 RepID=UPI0008DFC7F2|nr:serine hydrolase domain-containing protein [Lysobacter sp. cf310]SFL32135.1 CubicO group peptidase, beta-lactamase class C family [Lysobacter sp. cf310]
MNPAFPLALALSLVVVGSAHAGPASAPLAPAADANTRAVDTLVQRRMQQLGIPGLQVAVVRKDRTVLLRNYGSASVELGVPVTDASVFSLNSITKAFSGIAAGTAIAQGRLDPKAPLSRYLDDLPQAWRAVTIEQLMAHMSGLPDLMRAPTVEQDPAAAWAWTLAQPIRFAAGERYDYCQTNYTLLQRILNKLMARPADAALATPQFAAAGMRRTGYGDADAVVPGKGPNYRYRDNGPGTPRTLRPIYERFPPYRQASSGINSTAEDMANWAKAVLSDRLIDARTRELLWTPVRYADGKPGQWGLGWQVFARGSHRMVGMTGGGRSAVFLYPDDELAVIVLTNLSGAYPEDFIDGIAKIYAPDLPLTGIPALRIALDDSDYEHVETVLSALRARHPEASFPEAEFNDWGYRLLASGRPKQAQAIFERIVDLYPNSGNAYDSLAEARGVNGDRKGAIEAYRRALALDPKNTHAAAQLRRLETSP